MSPAGGSFLYLVIFVAGRGWEFEGGRVGERVGGRSRGGTDKGMLG